MNPVEYFVYAKNEGEDAIEFNAQVGYEWLKLQFCVPENKVNMFEILRRLWVMEENR